MNPFKEALNQQVLVTCPRPRGVEQSFVVKGLLTGVKYLPGFLADDIEFLSGVNSFFTNTFLSPCLT
jgi:hypothetical protein